ncbi:uncharacterized protein KD926_002968 [Aspergillus affinis]|uniref:uncharacterized protein n=1 Tax=Aspergillus affinis TaxID=1070780 RepID=UPI0022FED981|nr:uncharacterized protein KD926_002968 [Aspergillus affinis]KAI9035717.1 hypothetical protein KD926_002968 [Aspergillus affinis]
MQHRASNVVALLANSFDNPYNGTSSMTTTIYHTAWVSMVSKAETRDGVSRSFWLFPECFETVLKSQSPDGGFCVNGTQLDSILSTMAATLALCKHQKSQSILGCPQSPSELQGRIEKARAYLDQALHRWDVESTVQVGFEILVPSLLRMLQGEGLSWSFPARRVLMKLNRRKLDKIQPSMLYANSSTTLLHSLESFIGIVDFGKLTHRLVNGAMMGSPSSTAAYLMHCPQWDEEAERYLRFVVPSHKGGVPSAFPTSVFESSWVLSTLLGSGFTADALGAENVTKMANHLQARLEENDGTTGFARGMLPDADDTAKSIYSLSLLGRSPDCEAMIQAFEGPQHFRTYSLETKESFSANCNVLIALLASKNPSQHVSQIQKAIRFLCTTWINGKWGDKWNIEPQYAMMLFADSLAKTIEQWNRGALDGIDSKLLTDNLPLVTLQVLVRTLSSQSNSGSWKESAEITAYGLLTLKSLATLPWVKLALGSKVEESIELATRYLNLNERSWATPEVIWVEKVNYGSAIISETYCLASLRVSSSATSWTVKVSDLCKIPVDKLDRFCAFFGRLPIFEKEPSWRLRASIIEGYLLAPALRRAAVDINIFPHRETKYLDYIPLTWTTCNNASDFGLSTQTMAEMLVISLLNFQVDKWLEEVTEDSRLQGDFAALKTVIKELNFQEAIEYKKEKQPSDHQKQGWLSSAFSYFRGSGTSTETMDSLAPGLSGSDGEKAALLYEARSTLSAFIRFVMNKVSVASPPDTLRRRVSHELRTFLLAHVTHGEDNTHLSTHSQKAEKPPAFSPMQTYYEWVRTTSADHTSCPYSFEFFRCLVSSSACNGADCFAGTRTQYLAQDVCRHLATMCRQYNDYGSIARDREENNLNSINFPEFQQGEEEMDESCSQWGDNAKRSLFDIANYERECLELAVRRLQPEITEPVRKAWKVFLDVTDLYGQIYVVKDINSG